MKPWIPLICILCVEPFAIAAARPLATTEDQAAVAASPTTAGAPPPETAALYPRIGKWQVTIHTSPAENSAKGGVDHGVMTITKGPGGFSIVQDFRSQGVSGHIVGQSYAWWDAQAKAYKSVWCDNQQGCVEFTTTIAGNTWSTELDSTTDGKRTRTFIHASMSADHNAIHEEVTSSRQDGPAHLESASDYKRIASSPRTSI